jgi:hypothetical protein
MKLKLFLLSLFCCLNAYSQYEYRPGYIVKLDGKTEEGLINLCGSESNAKKCEFKKDSKSDLEVYLPGSIAAYRIHNSKYFVSKKVLIENVDKVLFLECLISGKSTIYYIQLDSQEHYFIELDGTLYEINNKEIVKVEFYRPDQIRRSNQYKGVLRYLFKDCPPVFEKVNNADFSKKSLINLSKEYHEYICKDEPCIIYEKKIPKKHIQLGVDFSYAKTKLEFVDDKMLMSLKPVMQYQFGINSQMNLDEEGAWNIQVAVRYYSYENEILNDTKFQVGGFPSDVHYKFSILKPEVQIKYKMKMWKLEPFGALGLYTNFFLSDKGYIYNERFDETMNFSSVGLVDDVNKGSENGMYGIKGELGFETKLKPGNISFALFYETILTTPFKGSYSIGLRCGYSFYL